MEQISIGPCIGGDIFGHFVTAKLKGTNDCRQGIVVSIEPLIIRGALGTYICEGTPRKVRLSNGWRIRR